MPLYRDEAIVLRTHKLGEADRIITLLTRDNGRVRAVAKGVRRTTSKFGSRLEPFTHVEVQLAEGRNLDTVTQAETHDAFAAQLGADYERYTAGTVMLETAERLVTEEKQPSTQQFLLLVGGLRAMVGGERRPGQVLDSYLLRSLAVAGYAPSFRACARCGTLPGPGGQHRWFNPSYGGMLCATCRVPGSAGPAPETVTLLGALLAGDWPVVEAADPRHLKEASGLVAAFLAWHVERGLRSLAYVER
jgi:DNA repair protein RecO (recombination protein O)